jgi:hypothetical protein
VLEFVQLFCFTNEDIEVFVEETNRYAEQFFEKTPRDTLPPKSRMRDWEPTDANEMKAFLALTILMGLVVKADLDEYWTTSPLVETPFFGAVMSRNRFELLLKFFHIADSSGARKKGEEGYDPLYRIRLLHDRYLKRSQETYTPEQNLALDEATMLWKGHVSYRVYNPNKPDKFGVKLYVVCESSSGYIVNWQVYTGKTEDPQEHGHTYRVVMDLLPDHLRGKGYRVYMDRYYSSPKLFHDLWSKELGATGTVMLNRKDMPKRAVQQKLQKGETVTVYKTHPNQLSCVKWKDKRDIYMLSNIDSVEMQDSGKTCRKSGEAIRKPGCVLKYNERMGGVDRNDQLAKYYTFARKGLKVWKKEFFFLTNSMVLQAYLIYRKYTQGKKLTQYQFRLKLVEELLTAAEMVNFPKLHQRRSSRDAEPLARLTARHFPSFIPRTEKKLHPTRKCVVCKARNIRKESIYWCGDCRAPLCVAPCFGDYHRLRHYDASNSRMETDQDNSACDDSD